MAREFDSELSRYITMVHAAPKLSREEEEGLLERWYSHSDIRARDELVNTQLRYVVAIALKYKRYGVPVSELVAEGNFGVVHALKKFEPARGNRFVTYAAYWIRAYILNYIIRSWSLVGVGSGALRSKMFFKLRRERIRVTNLLGEGEAADEALAEKLSIPKDKLGGMLRRLEARDVSLDTPLFDDSGATLIDALANTSANQEDKLIESRRGIRVQSLVRDAVKDLDKRERYIVENRMMADAEDEMSLAEIGRRLGVSRERARQLEARAKRKLEARITQLSAESGTSLELESAA
ncbi:MAG TPA: sigma-70 family RNA polymerase sigma factor [Polyangiaceae bacterium]|nr:sigma-70 family RNA polymerase sigma factor [Polyangiaceae bacterium]